MDTVSKDVILNAAESYCHDNGLRFTDSRRAVLDIVAKASKPLGAYDILQVLDQYLKNPKPPTVYRALEFLQAEGFVHRIESLNVYVVCSAGHQHKGSQYLICGSCGDIQEVHMCHMPNTLQEKVQDKGFQMKHWNTEIHGQCQQCVA